MKKHITWLLPVSVLLSLALLAFYFEIDHEFFKQYGAAIGPSLAFILGIIAFSLKYQFDESNEKNKAEEVFLGFTRLIEASSPPEYIDNVIHGDSGYSIDYDRVNGSNITTYYQRVLLIKKRLDDILEKKHSLMSEKDVIRLAEIKWWLDYSMKEIEKHRTEFNDVTPLFKKASLTEKLEDNQAANNALDSHFLNEKIVIFSISVGHENMLKAIKNNMTSDLDYVYPDTKK